ncbi:MAG: hypothetical protein WC926_00770 [Candidatus Paceibacterota bacterium]|jgi:hypothetical protein
MEKSRKCFHISHKVQDDAKESPYIFRGIPFVGGYRKNGEFNRGDMFYLEDVISSKSVRAEMLIRNPDGYHVKNNPHYRDGVVMDDTIYVDHISLEFTGDKDSEKYRLDTPKKGSNQVYVMYCPSIREGWPEYEGEKVIALKPGQKKEINYLGKFIRLAYKRGKIMLTENWQGMPQRQEISV